MKVRNRARSMIKRKKKTATEKHNTMNRTLLCSIRLLYWASSYDRETLFLLAATVCGQKRVVIGLQRQWELVKRCNLNILVVGDAV